MADTNKNPGAPPYINIALIAILAIVLIAILRPLFFPLRQDKASVSSAKAASRRSTPKPIYDINKVKMSAGYAEGRAAEQGDLKQERGAGGKAENNSAKAWARIGLKDRKQILDGVDDQIAAIREKVKKNPDDKRTKNILCMTELLKVLLSNGFDYEMTRATLQAK